MTAIDTSGEEDTVNPTGGLTTDPKVAVMDVVPAATPVTSPCVPGELLMVATAVLDEAHVTDEVITLVVPSA